MYVILDREPIGFCRICDVPFYSNRDTVAHLRSTDHRLAVAAQRAERGRRNRALALFTESTDPELEAHMRRVGERMLREGRWEVRPSERAGF